MTIRPNLHPTAPRSHFRSLVLARWLSLLGLSLAAGCTLDSRIGGFVPRDGSQSQDTATGSQDPGTGGQDAGTGSQDAATGSSPDSPTRPPITSTDQLDLLFMIDNSSSMQPLQTKLAQRLGDFMNVLKALPGGLPSLHVAVITSSLGAGMYANVPGCSQPLGDQGGLFQRPFNCNMIAGAQNFLVADHGMNNFSGDITDAFSCMTQVGQGGCGFEHQFSSTILALHMAQTPGDPNYGFLRRNALLGIVMLTNEDDCSTPVGNTSLLFNPGVDTVADPSGLGGLQSYRCNEFGHLCNGAPPPHNPPAAGATVTLSGCTSSEGMSPGPGGGAPDPAHQLITVDSFVSFLKGLKDYPNQVFVAALAGPSTPYIVAPTTTQLASGGSERQPSISHSCIQNSGEYADPGVRIKNWVDAFGANGIFEPICASDFQPALSGIANALVGMMGSSGGPIDGGTMGTGGSFGTGGVTGTGGSSGTGGRAGTGGRTGTGGSGMGGGGMGGAPSCQATCATAAGAVQPFASADDVYAALVGRWQICSGTQSAFPGAPADTIGVEYGPASSAPLDASTGGNMYYLVQGPSGPVRGAGFAYQLTYDVSQLGSAFQLNMHTLNSGFGGAFRYSPCPTEFEIAGASPGTSAILVPL